MKKLILSILLLCSIASMQAQTVIEDAISSFNGFQRVKSKYPDSAIKYLKTLVALNTNSAEDLIHNSFSQSFLTVFEEKMLNDTSFLAMLKQRNMTIDSVLSERNKDKKSAHIILSGLSNDTSIYIKDNIYPIAQWVNAQKHKNNPDQLLLIGNSYLAYLSSSNDIYTERKARYGLLIWQLMTKHNSLKATSDKILQLVYRKLKDAQIVEVNDNLTRLSKEKRAWYRYMFAYTNFISAQDTDKNENDQLAFLKLAYQYSPDISDKTVSSAYFYDMIFLLGEEKNSFEEDYLAKLKDDDEKYNLLLAMSMNDPFFKAKAKLIAKDQANFNNLWLQQFNKNFKQAPSFSLTQTDGTKYNLTSNKNQWTLIDFWGTWCGPCRKEHPDLQKLYKRTTSGEMPKLTIITIASRDNEEAVKGYMKEFNYTFPVAMSDNAIEKTYNVSSWPSKFLVSPEGRFVVIPFNVDWVKYIENYIN